MKLPTSHLFRRMLLLPGAAALCAPAALGQLHGAVAVEGEYAPEIIDVERINVFPRQVKFEMPAADLEYERRGVVTGFRPTLLTMGVTGWGSRQAVDASRGYVDLHLGSWLNSSLSAGATVLSDSTRRLGASLQFNSSSLFRAPAPEGMEMSRRALYDGTLAIDYTHRFTGTGLLDARLAYRLGYFNYYGTPLRPGDTGRKAPTQTLNALDLTVGWNAAGGERGSWHARLDVDYLGYRSLAIPGTDAGTYASLSADRETGIGLSGGYSLALGDRSSFDIDASLDVMLYSASRPDALAALFPTRAARLVTAPSDYAMLTLRPAYRFVRDNVNIRIGAVADLAFNAAGNGPDDHYSLFHIAPDVSAALRSGMLGVHASVTGGSRLHTLASLSAEDYYRLPLLSSTQPAYTPVDATVGIDLGPAAGFTAGLFWGYDVTLHTRAGGWYQAFLRDSATGIPSTASEGLPLYGFGRPGVDLHGMKAGLDLRYRSGTRFEIGAEAVYIPQNGRKGIFNGYDRSRWTVTADVMFRPVEKLRINLEYLYRGVRNIYMQTLSDVPGSAEPEVTLVPTRLSDLSDLRAAVSYSPLVNLELSCRAYNLLDRRTQVLPGLPSEGICVEGGVTFRF